MLVADSDPASAERIGLAAQCIPEAELIGAGSTTAEIMRLIRDREPNLLIIDLDMPDRNAFDMLQTLRPMGIGTEIICVSATERHALRAFDLNAVDYLLKPIGFDRLRQAVRRAEERIRAHEADHRFAELEQLMASLRAAAGSAPAPIRSFWTKRDGELLQVPADDVHWLEAAGDYVIAHEADREHFLSEPLRALQEKLDPQIYLRVHRSIVVNTMRIRSLRKRRRRGYAVVLESGKQLVVGPTYEAAVLAAMKAPRWR